MIYRTAILIYSVPTRCVVIFFILYHLLSYQYNQKIYKVYDTNHKCNQFLMIHHTVFLIILYLVIITWIVAIFALLDIATLYIWTILRFIAYCSLVPNIGLLRWIVATPPKRGGQPNTIIFIIMSYSQTILLLMNLCSLINGS